VPRKVRAVIDPCSNTDGAKALPVWQDVSLLELNRQDAKTPRYIVYGLAGFPC
jgi:hypothetical protein